MLDRLLADVSFALRQVRRAPFFHAMLIAVIAVGTGAASAMLSILHAVFLQPLPYANAEALVALRTTAPWTRGGSTNVTLPDYLDWKAQSKSFERMAASARASFGLSAEGAKPIRLSGAFVSGDFFPVLGVRPLRGRLIGPADDSVGAPRIAVLGAASWRQHFGADPQLVGRAVTLNGLPHTVVGIAPDGFGFGSFAPNAAQVWTPLAVSQTDYAKMASPDRIFEGSNHFLDVVGRLAPGRSLEQAQVELATIAQRLAALYPERNAKKGVFIGDLREFLTKSSRANVWLLLASVALLFLIVCANVANLLLTRAQARRGEFALRQALGATGARLTRQILIETGVVFALGAIAAIAFGSVVLDVFAAAALDRRFATLIELRLDPLVMTASLSACLSVGVLFALIPALWVARLPPQAVLSEAATRASLSRSQRKLRGVLVIAQLGLAFVLLATSALIYRALDKLSHTSTGFDERGLATATIALPEARYDVTAANAFFRDALAKLSARPDVESVSGNCCVPFVRYQGWTFYREGQIPPPNEAHGHRSNVIAPGYFQTMKIPLLSGRDFGPEDRRDGKRVAIISDATRRAYFPNENPIGQRIDSGVDDEFVWREIVGVVADVRGDGLHKSSSRDVYLPLEQDGLWDRTLTLVARSRRAESLLRELPALIESLDPSQDVSILATLEQQIADSLQTQRNTAIIIGAFAFFALVLAVLGLFGLISYITAQRTRELGLRLALGATSGAIVRLVLRDGLRLLAFGLALGAGAAWAVSNELAVRMPQIGALDAVFVLGIAAALGTTGVLGCLIPALRAASMDPSEALRYE